MPPEKTMPETKETGIIKIRKTIVELQKWLTFVLRKWWLVVIFAALGIIAGIFYASRKSIRYESKLTFALEDNEGGLGGALSLAAEFGLNVGGGKSVFAGDNIIEIIKSRTIIERVLLEADTAQGSVMTFADRHLAIQKEHAKSSNTKPSRIDSVSFPLNLPRNKFSYLQDSVLFNIYTSIINGALAIGKPDKKLNIIEVSFSSLDERYTKEFTDRLMKETTGYYTEIKTKRSKQTLEILEQRVGAMRGSLSSAINSRFSLPDANVNPAFASAQAPIQNKQADIQAYGGAYGELFKNLEMARFQYLKDIPLLQIIDDANYPMKRVKASRLKAGLLFGIVATFFVVFGLTLTYLLKSEKEAETLIAGSLNQQ